jgi:hypothetical protein
MDAFAQRVFGEPELRQDRDPIIERDAPLLDAADVIDRYPDGAWLVALAMTPTRSTMPPIK